MNAMKTVKRCVAVAVCALALVSSVIGLWHVCIGYALMSPLIALGVLAVFDGSALVFGLTVALLPKAWGAWAGVIVCALLSAGAQAAAAPLEAGPWRLLHGAPAIGAIWALHNAVKGERPVEKAKPAKRAPRSKGPGREAAGAGAEATAPAAPLARELGHDASVLQLDAARREGARRASSHDAGPPNYTPEQMADLVAARLGESDPSQRRVWELCKAIDPTWTQANGRAVSTILKNRKDETETGS